MCRAGLPDDVLNYYASFPHEPWLEIVQNITYKSNNDEENSRNSTVHLVLPSMLFQRGIQPFVHRSDPTLEDGPIFPWMNDNNNNRLNHSNLNVNALFHMYRPNENSNRENDQPTITFQCNLRYIPQGNGYTISHNFSRIVSNAISDLEITSMSANIFAQDSESGNQVQVATMQRVPIHPNMNQITVQVSPPIYSITINLSNSNASPISNFNTSLFNLLEFHFIENPGYQHNRVPGAFDG